MKKEKLGAKDNVFLVCRDKDTAQVMGITRSKNVVTQRGLNHLALSFATGTQTLTLRSRAQISVATLIIKDPTVSANRSWFSAAIAGTASMDTGWPQINGRDSGNNPGAFATDITTFKATFGASEALGTIKGLSMHSPRANDVVSYPIFNYSTFTRANWRVKTASDLLTAYVGIEFRET